MLSSSADLLSDQIWHMRLLQNVGGWDNPVFSTQCWNDKKIRAIPLGGNYTSFIFFKIYTIVINGTVQLGPYTEIESEGLFQSLMSMLYVDKFYKHIVQRDKVRSHWALSDSISDT